MNTILTTLNSKFIHSALSIRYLKAFCMDICDIDILEFTINQNIDYIAGEIYKGKPNIIGFSTYIWNKEETLRVCEILKLVKPDIKIILGGPEVSFDSVDVLKKYWFVDFVITGEGEIPFKELLIALYNGRCDFSEIMGLTYREGERIVENPPGKQIKDLDLIPSPYSKVDEGLEDKIVYYESSRGCPFNCQFCLSSTIKGVRYFSLNRVKEDLERLIDSRVRQVKFVDRTFNSNKKYAMEIMKFIMDKDPENMNFHFEVTAHLLDEDMLEFLEKAKPGLFQFEIGVQSTNERTIEAIGRTTDFDKLRKVCKRIKAYKNIHQHLDLIAGLPYEGYESFKRSFNDVYDIRPEKIQLGFLKLLKGSGLRRDKDKYGFKFLDIPPYEVLETDYIKYDEMLRLKGIEDLVEKFYNEEYFTNTISYLIKNKYDTAFDFFEDLLMFWESKGYHKISHSRNRLYEILWEFCIYRKFEDIDVINEVIKYDYLFSNPNSNIPKFITRIERDLIESNKHKILKDEVLLKDILPHYIDMATKKLIKKVHIESFRIDILRLVDNDYNSFSSVYDRRYILFEYKDRIFNRCSAYDITKYIKGSELVETD
ncbi:MAG: DUF4080 domain-containing protein [Tissierellia bacterium]|nr:DUF4080 domain-containing protein [Tissierellia bacterium]